MQFDETHGRGTVTPGQYSGIPYSGLCGTHCIPYSVDHGRCAFRIPAIWVWCVLYSRFISGSCLYISKVDTKLGVFEPHCPTRHKVESIHIFSKTRCARMSVVSNSSHVAAHRLHTPSHELTRAHSATRTCMPPHRCAHTPHTHFPTPLNARLRMP